VPPQSLRAGHMQVNSCLQGNCKNCKTTSLCTYISGMAVTEACVCVSLLAALADLLAVDIGSQMTKIVPGRVSTEASWQFSGTVQWQVAVQRALA
jgi:hypothetical protein